MVIVIPVMEWNGEGKDSIVFLMNNTCEPQSGRWAVCGLAGMEEGEGYTVTDANFGAAHQRLLYWMSQMFSEAEYKTRRGSN